MSGIAHHSLMQKNAFLAGEGDAYFDRNRQPFDPDRDSISLLIREMAVESRSLLEVGCGRGERVSYLSRLLGSSACGIDPSAMAIASATRAFPACRFKIGTADHLEFSDRSFDLVIFGFCLYLSDPEDHFRIASEAARVLQDGGFLIIHDFCVLAPYRNTYKHKEGISSYKMDWAKFFTAHPTFRLISRGYAGRDQSIDESVCVDLIKKDVVGAFPPRTDSQ